MGLALEYSRAQWSIAVSLFSLHKRIVKPGGHALNRAAFFDHRAQIKFNTVKVHITKYFKKDISD